MRPQGQGGQARRLDPGSATSQPNASRMKSGAEEETVLKVVLVMSGGPGRIGAST
jgi:hypothetical protein